MNVLLSGRWFPQVIWEKKWDWWQKLEGVEILKIILGGGQKFENNIPTFYGQDRWKTFVYEQKGFEVVQKRDFGVKNWDFVKII